MGLSLTVILKKLFNQVDMGQHHSAATVPLEAQLGEGVTLRSMQLSVRRNSISTWGRIYSPSLHILGKEGQVLVPFVPHNFPARETSDRDNLNVQFWHNPLDFRLRVTVQYGELTDHRSFGETVSRGVTRSSSHDSAL